MIITHAQVGDKRVDSMKWNNQLLYQWELNFENYTWTNPFSVNAKTDCLDFSNGVNTMTRWYKTANPEIVYLGAYTSSWASYATKFYGYVKLIVPKKTKITMHTSGLYRCTYNSYAYMKVYGTAVEPQEVPDYMDWYDSHLNGYNIDWQLNCNDTSASDDLAFAKSQTVYINNTEETQVYYVVWTVAWLSLAGASRFGFNRFSFTSEPIENE